ncbi:hypothetical protein Tco_0237732 [Tanacetum coccineum]
MSRTIPPIPPPLGTKSGNIGSPNRAIIKCKTAKAIWNDPILAHEGLSDTRNTKIAALRLKFNAFKALECEKDSNSNVEEDLRSSSEFIADLNAECHERDLLANQKRFYKRSGRDEESVSSKDDGTTKIKAFMKIAEEEPYVGKVDARSNYTYVDLHYVEDQRKILVNKFNLLKQELSLHNKVTLDQLLSEQIPGNIVKALGGRGKRKEKISWKEVIFTKADESSSMSIPEITSDSEFECETQEPLPPLSKLNGDAPAGTSNSLISLADLTLNMADLRLNIRVLKKTKPTSDKVSPTHAIKKKTETKSPDVSVPQPEKKVDLSAEQLLLTLTDEVKSLKEQIKVPSDNSPSVSQTGSLRSSKGKQTTWFGPCKHCGFKNHLAKDCYLKPKCSTCGSIDHLNKDHLEQTAVNKTLTKLKAQSFMNSSFKKAHMILKPFKECKYYGFNDYHSDNYEYYLGCEEYLKRSVWYLDCGCSRHMTGVNQYLHIYSKESGPKVVLEMTLQKTQKDMAQLIVMVSPLPDSGNHIQPNDEVVLIAPRRRGVYVIDMSSYNEESNTCFFAKASPDEYSRSIIVKRHGKIAYNVFRGISPDISYFYVFGCPMHIHNHRDHLGKFDEKANNGFFLGYSLVAKAFKVFNIRRQEMEETYHVTFSEDDEAISQSNIEGDAINSNENRSFLDDEFLKPRNKVTQCSRNIEHFPYIPVYENIPKNISPTDSPILQDSVSLVEPLEFTSADDRPSLNEHDLSKSVDILEHAEIQDTIINELISEPLAGITTKSRVRVLEAASAHECMYVNFLSKMEPKKLIEALEEEG